MSVSLYANLSTGQKVVVKTLNKKVGSKQLKSFEKEVAVMRLLNHPNIIKYINSLEHEKRSKIVMEYADGGDLQKLIENGAVDELICVRILYQLLLALDSIHKKKIVHKDVKPENILLDSDGNVKLADFGIVKILEYEGDVGTTMAYSQDYGAPELFNEGKYDTKYDIFSAGVLAYRMFVGCLPFTTQDQRTNGQFKPFPSLISPFLRETIIRMLNPNPRKSWKRSSDKSRRGWIGIWMERSWSFLDWDQFQTAQRRCLGKKRRTQSNQSLSREE